MASQSPRKSKFPVSYSRFRVWSEKQKFAYELRQNPTPAAEQLWDRLTIEETGAEFRQEVILYGWIVDFLAPKWRLIIEVDGAIHEQQKEYDAFRDRILRKHGYTVLRFSNDMIFGNIETVLEKIAIALNQLGMDYRWTDPAWRARKSSFNNSIARALETYRRNNRLTVAAPSEQRRRIAARHALPR